VIKWYKSLIGILIMEDTMAMAEGTPLYILAYKRKRRRGAEGGRR